MSFRFLWLVFLFNDFGILNGYALIQRILEILADVCHYYLFHIRSDSVHSALMDILHCRLAVWIGVTLGRGVDDMVTIRYEIGTCPDTIHILHVDEKVVRFRQFLLGCILLEDDEVTAHFRIGILSKEVVGQTDGTYKVCMAQHFRTDGC